MGGHLRLSKRSSAPAPHTLLAANFAFVQHAIIGTVIGSAGMNAFAFAADTPVAIPALVYAPMRVGAALDIA